MKDDALSREDQPLAFDGRHTAELIVDAELPGHSHNGDLHASDGPHRPRASELAAFCQPSDGGELRLACPKCDATLAYFNLTELPSDQPVTDDRFRWPSNAKPAVRRNFRCTACGDEGYPQWVL